MGSATLAQALLRDLLIGETRQALLSKALAGVKKREFQCHAAMLQKCQAIIAGKPVAKRRRFEFGIAAVSQCLSHSLEWPNRAPGDPIVPIAHNIIVQIHGQIQGKAGFQRHQSSLWLQRLTRKG